MLTRLRLKFVCINMVFLTGMLCVILGLIVQFTRSNLEAESLRMMQAVAERPAVHSLPGHPPEEVRLPYFAVRIDGGGNMSVTGGGYYDLSDEAFLLEVAGIALDSKHPSGVLKEYNLRFLHAAVPGAHCIVFADITSELATLRHLTRICALAGVIGFAAFLLASLLLARWAVKPVARAWAQQKQFVADASHELKTPLTVIITNAELLQNPDNGSIPRHRLAENILAMAHQMHGLTGSLLELARMDSGAAKPAFSALDFSRLVSHAVLPFEAAFFERGLTVAEQIGDGIQLRGSEPHLRQVVEILLDNAQKYAAPGGEVTVALQRKGRRHCLLSVSSPGAEISPEDLRNIFKRFYRLDKARSMNHSYGLGLAIAQDIVTAHHGRIWAESKNGLNTFFIELPV